MNHTDTSAY